ncbi:MAG: Sec-independent protein translocase protein TatB [Pikeienuella sp.]
MLDIGMMELFVIGALALIVVGPKDLPGLLRTVGQYVGKARGMAKEFQRTMEDAAREADLGDVADAVKSGGNLNKLPFDNQIVDSLKEFEKTVKSETQEAAAAVNTVTAEVEPPAVLNPEVAAKEAKLEKAKATVAEIKKETAVPVEAEKTASAETADKTAAEKSA